MKEKPKTHFILLVKFIILCCCCYSSSCSFNIEIIIIIWIIVIVVGVLHRAIVAWNYPTTTTNEIIS